MSMRVVSTLWRTWSRPVFCGTFPNAKERAARPTLGEEQKAKAVTKEVWATEAHRRRSLAAAWYFSPTLEGGWEAWEAAARP